MGRQIRSMSLSKRTIERPMAFPLFCFSAMLQRHPLAGPERYSFCGACGARSSSQSTTSSHCPCLHPTSLNRETWRNPNRRCRAVLAVFPPVMQAASAWHPALRLASMSVSIRRRSMLFPQWERAVYTVVSHVWRQVARSFPRVGDFTLFSPSARCRGSQVPFSVFPCRRSEALPIFR